MGTYMAMRKKKTNLKTEVIEYTAIAQTDDLPLAQDCVRLLKDKEIPAVIEEIKRNTHTVKVLQTRFNEAYIIIESKISLEGYFDIYTDPQQQKDPNQAA